MEVVGMIKVSEALKALTKLYEKNFAKLADEMIEKAATWQNGSIDAVLVYDTETDEIAVVKESASTSTPGFVYLFRLSGNDKPDVNSESLYLDLKETDFEEMIISKMGLTEKQEKAFRYLLKLAYFRQSELEGKSQYWKNASKLDYSADMIEEWGIGCLLEPEREITIDDLDDICDYFEDVCKISPETQKITWEQFKEENEEAIEFVEKYLKNPIAYISKQMFNDKGEQIYIAVIRSLGKFADSIIFEKHYSDEINDDSVPDEMFEITF